MCIFPTTSRRFHVQFTYMDSSNNRIAIILLVIVLIVGFILYGVFQTDNTELSEQIIPAPEETLAWRKLSADVKYKAPGIMHHVEFSIYVDDNEEIQDVDAVELAHDGYEEKLDSFSDLLITTIKGKKLSELEAVDKVGTSSLTTGGFNEALMEMQSET